MKGEKIIRVGQNFAEELKEIKKDLRKRVAEKISDRKITSLIPLHNFWPQMKEEIKKKIIDPTFISSKTGVSALANVFIFMIVMFVGVLFIGIWAYTHNIITTNLLAIGSLNGLNYSQYVADTIGVMNTALFDQLNFWGLVILFGSVIAILINAYFTRDDYPRIFFLIDFIIMVFAWILASYLSNTYETIIALPEFTSTFTNNLAGASTFLLNLPVIITVVEVMAVIITYVGIPKGSSSNVGST